MAPTPLGIATSSINRLLKEESSYKTELSNQETRLEKLKAGGGDPDNVEFQLKQEVSVSIDKYPFLSFCNSRGYYLLFVRFCCRVTGLCCCAFFGSAIEKGASVDV